MASSEMPKYRCHKEVWALKIKEIEPQPDGGALLVPEESGYAPVRVDPGWVQKRDKELAVGGYYVVYRGGYSSFSPAQAFESGYTRI